MLGNQRAVLIACDGFRPAIAASNCLAHIRHSQAVYLSIVNRALRRRYFHGVKIVWDDVVKVRPNPARRAGRRHACDVKPRLMRPIRWVWKVIATDSMRDRLQTLDEPLPRAIVMPLHIFYRESQTAYSTTIDAKTVCGSQCEKF